MRSVPWTSNTVGYFLGVEVGRFAESQVTRTGMDNENVIERIDDLLSAVHTSD